MQACVSGVFSGGHSSIYFDENAMLGWEFEIVHTRPLLYILAAFVKMWWA